MFSLVRAFVLFRESWPAGWNAPPLGAPLWLEAMPELSGELSAGFLVALGTFRNQHTPRHQAFL